MSERKIFIVVIIIALGIVLACGQAETPETKSDAVGPFVDLDPDPARPEVFAWYRTPPPGKPGFPHRIRLVHKESVFATMDPDTGECDFRADFIGGAEIRKFTVWDENAGQMSDGGKVRLRSLGEHGDVKIEVVIEKDVVGNRLHWVIDDKTDTLPACTMRAARVEEGEENIVPVELEALELNLFREISGSERVATDFKFWVTYNEAVLAE